MRFSLFFLIPSNQRINESTIKVIRFQCGLSCNVGYKVLDERTVLWKKRKKNEETNCESEDRNHSRNMRYYNKWTRRTAIFMNYSYLSRPIKRATYRTIVVSYVKRHPRSIIDVPTLYRTLAWITNEILHRRLVTSRRFITTTIGRLPRENGRAS